jgi:hypothetical protein
VVRRQNVAEQQVFYTLPRVEREQRDEPAGLPSYTPPPLPDAPAQPPASNIAINTTIGTLAAFSGECFAAETPIETFEGARPIELVQAGDRVLSQNVETGELEYKTVLRRTLRRGADLMELTLGMETLVVTPGHPFFVVGKGWQVAKHLQAGDRLATANGIVAVEKIQSCASREVYNLVVSDFSTFFVGNRRLLVHDDLPIRETTALLPGLTIADIK